MTIRYRLFAITYLVLCAACGSRNIGSGSLKSNDGYSRSDASVRADASQEDGKCGDGIRQDGEACDGDIEMTTCQSLGFRGGALSCDPDTCKFDTSMCTGPRPGTGGTGSGSGGTGAGTRN